MNTWLRALSLVFITAAACFSISANTGFASSRGSSGQGYDVYPKDSATFVGMDWFCAYLPSSRSGRVISCGRESQYAGIGVSVTGGWVRVFKYPSSNSRYKTLLYQHRRNP
jgi:hypothetical protein